MTENPNEHSTLGPIPRSLAEQIWKRAIELQDREGEMVTPDMLLEVARELDVHPAFVERAMQDVTQMTAAASPAAPPPAKDDSPSPVPPHQAAPSSDEVMAGCTFWLVGIFTAIGLMFVRGSTTQQSDAFRVLTSEPVALIFGAICVLAGMIKMMNSGR